MLFNSIEFGLFIIVVFPLYLCLRQRGQNRMLLVASYIFYGWWDWRFLGLIVLTSAVDYSIGLGMAGAPSVSRRKQLVALSVFANLGILGFFKYFNFFASSLAHLFDRLGLPVSEAHLSIILPVGISFYTFQSMSYTIDVYRGHVAAARSFLDFLLYVSFFPQLVAGPIERASHLLPQVLSKRTVTTQGIREGGWLIFWGLFKKIYVADNLAKIVDRVYAPGSAAGAGEVLLATYAFAFQIYSDFSGYSDIARGLGRCMGFDIMENFRFPYLSTNPREFWRRWHISLSTWLRDYLYKPLGGNRKGAWSQHRNLWITMLLGGLWHGAAWHFVLWGAFHGALLSIHRIIAPKDTAGAPPAGGILRAGWVVLFFHITCLGWMIFRAESLPHLVSLLQTLAGGGWLAGETAGLLSKLLLFASPLAVVEAFMLLTRRPAPFNGVSPIVRGLAYGVILYLILLLGAIFKKSFIYFQF